MHPRLCRFQPLLKTLKSSMDHFPLSWGNKTIWNCLVSCSHALFFIAPLRRLDQSSSPLPAQPSGSCWWRWWQQKSTASIRVDSISSVQSQKMFFACRSLGFDVCVYLVFSLKGVDFPFFLLETLKTIFSLLFGARNRPIFRGDFLLVSWRVPFLQ